MTSLKCASVLLLFISVAFASEQVFGVSQNLLIMLGIALAIVAAMLAIAFTFARAFAMRELEAWVKSELGHWLYSLCIVAFFIIAAGAIETISREQAEGLKAAKGLSIGGYNPGTGRWNGTWPAQCPTPCNVYIARAFLGYAYEQYSRMMKELAKHYAQSLLIESAAFGAGFEFVSVIIPSVNFGLDFHFPFWADRAIYNQTLRTALGWISNALLFIKAQEAFLFYVSSLTGALFAFGLVLRVAWFTRKLGGLLVALAIGLYAIFPLTYILAWYAVDVRTVIAADAFDFPSTWAVLTPAATDPRAVLFTQNILQGPQSQTPERPGLLDGIARAWLIMTFIPAIAVFTLIGFVRHFSPMIGGDVEIAGLTRLI